MDINLRTPFARGGDEDQVVVVSGGREYVGWQRLTLTREIGAAASVFGLDMGREPVLGRRSVVHKPLTAGAAVDIHVGGALILSGRAERVDPKRGPDDHSRTIQGRSHTAALVDSSVTTSPLQYKGLTAPGLARRLAQPYGIKVVAPADEGRAIPSFDVNQGESVQAAVERAARNRGMELTDDAHGRLVLLRPGIGGRAAAPELRHLDGPDGAPDARNNVIESKGSFSTADRFQEIEVRSQSDPLPWEQIKKAAGVSATARDPAITWPRKLVLVPDQQMTAADARARAEYEVTRRAGMGVIYTPTLAGWRRQPGGALWEINVLHAVRDVVQGLDRNMLVTAVTFTLDGDGGHQTQLKLQPPEAFAANPDALRDVASDLAYDRLRRQFADNGDPET